MKRKVVGKRTIGSGNWLRLAELDYSIEGQNDSEKNNNLKWESVERTTKPNSSDIDGKFNLYKLTRFKDLKRCRNHRPNRF